MQNECRQEIWPCSSGALRGARAFAHVASIISTLVGCIVLIGWAVNSPMLKGAIGVPITIKANTAACLILAGASLWLLMSPKTSVQAAGRALGALVAIIGGLTFSQHLTGWDWGIDQLLFREPAGEVATASPGRMGPPASLSFLILGLSLLLLDWRTLRGRFPFRYTPLMTMVVSLVSLIGYSLDAPTLYSVHVTGIAWPTALTIFLLSLGIVMARPDNLILLILCGNNVGGLAARRLLIPAVGTPFILLILYGAIRDAGLIEASLARGILAVIMMAALTSIVFLTAHGLAVAARRQEMAENQVRRSEQELSDFFENAAVGLHWVGPDGIILRANRADMSLLGFAPGEYVGRHIAEFHVDQNAAEDLLGKLKRGNSLKDYPARLRCKDGSIREVLITSSALFVDGNFVHSRCFTIDVTDRKRTEEALQASENRLRLAQSVARVGTFEWNIQTGVNTWTPELEAMYGLRPGEFGKTQRAFETLVHAEDRPAVVAKVEHALATGEPTEHEWRVVWPNGTTHWIAGRFQCFHDDDAQPLHLSGVNIDITERKKAEAEREMLLESERAARADAERASRLRDDFLAVVSHELRTPLNSILGWVHMLRRSSHDPQVSSEGVDAIERGARAQAQLVEDLLDMNRIITGKMRLDVCIVELPSVIEAAVATVRPATEAKNISVRSVLDTRVGPVRGDPARLQQVVWNLLSNAVKFTPKGGKIEVVLRRLDSQVEITVHDTGVGIKADFLPHVFERFRQADSSTTRLFGGLGLGLSIVRHLVELHGGTIQVHSEGEGKGATFSVRLPLAPVREDVGKTNPKIESAPCAEVENVDLRGVRVLVVDDDVEARELVRRVLAHRNADVVTAESAMEALDILQSEELDIVISDIGMPQMDGYQFIRRVRELDRNGASEIPAVALTAYARSEDRTRAVLSGYQMHIAKPVEPLELIATVASLTGRTQSAVGTTRES